MLQGLRQHWLDFIGRGGGYYIVDRLINDILQCFIQNRPALKTLPTFGWCRLQKLLGEDFWFVNFVKHLNWSILHVVYFSLYTEPEQNYSSCKRGMHAYEIML